MALSTRVLPFLLAGPMLLGGAADVVAEQAAASSQQPAPAARPAPAEKTTWVIRNWTRGMSWRFFEPAPNGGDPDYTYAENRLQVGVQRTARKYDATAMLQYVQLGGLPTRASGPGPLGTGALYFDHSGRANSRQVYLRYLNARFKDLTPGLNLQVGRMAYTSGAESPSGDERIEAIKRQRLDSRMIGEFEWSMFQRSYDGVRVDLDRRRWHATAAAFRPTQGGFEDAAGVHIDRVDLMAATVTLKPGTALPHTDWHVFAYRYNDARAVRARPDNTGLPAAQADVHISSFGSALIGAFPQASGRLDAVAWIVGQTGSWYRQPHRGYAIAAELGYQRLNWPGRPWLRGGLFRASGDPDPTDDKHNTFFPMMPTVRKYSFSTTYSLMNLNDLFVQGLFPLRPNFNVRLDLHLLDLVTAEDRWYSGSGATQKRGTIFGYAGRPSRGATSLGTIVEGAADYTFSRHWSINAYVGVMNGGEVVRSSFAGHRLTFAYVENVLQF